MDAYASAGATAAAAWTGVHPEPVGPPPEPHPIQQEALAALEATRAAGNTAGLVVLATGLGKTWLSAFDTQRAEAQRVLFIAHREEILAQSRDTFRRIRPDARLGFPPRLGAHLPPADRLLAFEVPARPDGHTRAHRRRRPPRPLPGAPRPPLRRDRGHHPRPLCRFQYFGVPDEVDYRKIPWKNARFDEEELTNHVATRSRARNAYEQLQKRGRSALVYTRFRRSASATAKPLVEQPLELAGAPLDLVQRLAVDKAKGVWSRVGCTPEAWARRLRLPEEVPARQTSWLP